MKRIIILLAAILTGVIYAQSYNGPESVEWDASNNRWLISNTVSHAILARDLNGNLTTFVASTTNGPHGIEILGDTLYACCGSRIKGYDLATGTEVVNINLGGSFLNGMTTDGDSVLYVTDFSAKDIIRVNPRNGQFYTMSSNTITTPNGILYDGANNRCIFVNWGSSAPIKQILLTPPYTVSTITSTTLGNCDGITKAQDGYYYVTAWSNNRLNRFRPDFTGGHTVINVALASPADIDFKPGSTDTVGVPNSGNNTCTFIPLNQPIAEFTSSTNSICVDDTVTYTDGSIRAASISWSFTGGNPSSGSSSPMDVVYGSGGNYTTTLTATNAFGTNTNSSSVDVYPTTDASISASGNDLSTSTTYDTYQWYMNGSAIGGATSQNYTVSTGGEYYCVVTENGCVDTSNMLISTLSLEDFENSIINLFPNPATTQLTVQFGSQDLGTINYKITDLSGRDVIRSAGGVSIPGSNQITVQLENLSNGTYIISLWSGGMSWQREFIVNRQ